MRSLPDPGDLLLNLLVLLLVLTDALLYSGVFVSPQAVDLRDAVPSPVRPLPAATPSPAAHSLRPDEIAERDSSAALPGRFVPAQGRQHTAQYPLGAGVPYCEPGPVRPDCYASNPPTSGLHLPVQPLIVLPDGHRMKVPPDPGVYEVAVPREAVPHIEEHAGVYAGYRCATAACEEAVARLTAVVRQELSLGARVVLSPDPDLDEDTIALASWTRVDAFAADDYDDERARAFIKAHSCRFDPEQFCRERPLN